jgi:drug/metabolite transporter (DMT)-like permease
VLALFICMICCLSQWKGLAVGVVWGLISALGFGTADFIARGISVRLSAYHALFYIHFVSGVLLTIVVLFDGIPSTATAGVVGLGLVLGSVNTLGTLLLYRALAIGKVSIVSPVVSTFGGVTLILSLLAGDTITTGGLFSLLLMLIGIVIVSRGQDDASTIDERGKRPGLRGLPEAVISALALGVNAWGLQFVVEPLGSYIPTLLGRIMTVILLTLLSRPLRQSIAVPPREYWLRFGAVGLITTIGEVAYNVGIQGMTPGIVAVLSSLFGAVTVILALIFLQERLARHQWIGVGVIFVSVVLIGIFQNFVSP